MSGSHLVASEATTWGSFQTSGCAASLSGEPLLPASGFRGTLYPLSDNSYWLGGVQLLDGVGAGIYGAAFPLIVAEPDARGLDFSLLGFAGSRDPRARKNALDLRNTDLIPVKRRFADVYRDLNRDAGRPEPQLEIG